MHDSGKIEVIWQRIEPHAAGQRIDNFLLRELKGVPKSHIYRILRTGQVRVNSRRVDATYRVAAGDNLRIPPLRRPAPKASPPAERPASHTPNLAVLYEDDALLIVDKPSGLAVHGGSGVSLGLIEELRRRLPELRFLELVHRLDKETSGILLLAKKRAALIALHASLREAMVTKRYLALVHGAWPKRRVRISAPLHKFVSSEGERRVSVRADGKVAHTSVRLQQRLERFSLLEATLETGRTHQIRVHLAHAGFPVAGDDKYGDFALNRELKKLGLKRMFLHATQVIFTHPLTGERIDVRSLMPKELAAFVAALG